VRDRRGRQSSRDVHACADRDRCRLAAAILPLEIEERVRQLLTAGRKIEAIKLARDATYMGVKEAKDLVESME
jgi:ribosomal protein L7/L12